MSKHLVTPRGANELMVEGSRPEVGSVIDTTGWQTVPTLLAQGLLKEIVELPPSLPEDFPFKSVLESAGYGSVAAVHFLTDRQLIALPVIGEAAVEVIRSYIAQQRGEDVLAKDSVELSDVLNDSEIELVQIARGEQSIAYLPAGDGREDGIQVGAALKGVILALGQANFLELHLTSDEISLIGLARPDTDFDSILLAMREPDGSYKLSEPLKLLLERLGLTYPPPAPAVPAEGEVPPPAELEHPASDPEKDAESVTSEVTGESVHPKGEEVKKEEKAPSSRGRTLLSPRAEHGGLSHLHRLHRLGQTARRHVRRHRSDSHRGRERPAGPRHCPFRGRRG